MSRRLRRLGVRIIGGPGATVVAVAAEPSPSPTPRAAERGDDLTAGFGVLILATRSGLRTDAIGWLLTDETLTASTTRAWRPAMRRHHRECHRG